MSKRVRDEAGNGCLMLILIVVVLGVLLGFCSSQDAGTSDCYATPGAQEGSAQWQRDVQRCIDS